MSRHDGQKLQAQSQASKGVLALEAMPLCHCRTTLAQRWQQGYRTAACLKRKGEHTLHSEGPCCHLSILGLLLVHHRQT